MASFPDARPDPDQLLEQIRSEGERARLGKLRIYFGAGAGVGKTYAMLNAAQREQRAGREVLVGVIETHGRGETAELLAGLTQLPQRAVPYRGRTLFEFDLDGALAAHPAVLLVDELAHSNAVGSRHPKRWQDVQELLEAGIDVWSAVNVQHLESLNGTVGAITGIRVHETVPDTVLGRASVWPVRRPGTRRAPSSCVSDRMRGPSMPCAALPGWRANSMCAGMRFTSKRPNSSACPPRCATAPWPCSSWPKNWEPARRC